MIASPTHLDIITAIMMGTMYVSPPVSSNIMTTSETERGEGGRKSEVTRNTEQIKALL